MSDAIMIVRLREGVEITSVNHCMHVDRRA
jgi:hypothetical protein